MIAGPHGAGKDTLEALFTASQTDATRHVRYSTRRRAAGEVQGQEYNFVSQREFDDMVEQAEFLDYLKFW